VIGAPGPLGIVDATAALRWAAEKSRNFADLMGSLQTCNYRERAEVRALAAALDDLATAGEAGVLTLPPTGTPDPAKAAEFVVFHGMFAVVDPYTIPFVDERDPDVRARFLAENLDTAAAAVARRRQEVPRATRRARAEAAVRRGGGEGRRVAEGLLTAGLLGSLPAFPDAEMDVVLDVRGHLRRARSAFRSAMVAGARDIDAGLRAGEDAQTLIADVRRRDVDPALAWLDAELVELGVADTLLRAVDTGTVTAASISIGAASVAGALGDLGAAVAGALASPAIVAAAGREIAHRRRRRRELQATPYWLLREADRLTRAGS
jgi:hypothetical protein